jgi:NAD(P)-dependent dehydrogenase (short-subunit alcohol dehydrogenase family)
MGHVDLSKCTALVTGANRGLGKKFVIELLRRGATVYAGARNPDSIDVDGVTPLAIDVTDPASVAAAAARAQDVTLLVNNAGMSNGTNLLTSDLADVRQEFDTNVFGVLTVTRAFAPVIEGNGGGAILNILSVLSWVSMPLLGGYCASKAAAWSATNALRVELADRGIHVTGLHVGLMETDMTEGMDAPKSDPADVAAQALDGVASGAFEVVADDLSRRTQSALSGGVAVLYPQLKQ